MIEEKYIEFELVLGNGDKCKVSYCDSWGVSLFGKRTIHFEFRDCFSISRTLYKSEFRIVGVNEKNDPKEAAKQIIEQITGINVHFLKAVRNTHEKDVGCVIHDTASL